MNDTRTALRSLVTYVVCVSLALFLGYILANPLDYQSMAVYGILAALISAPLLLRFHYPFMVVAWNMGALLFFLPARLDLWMVAICASYFIAFTHRIMEKRVQFLSVPQLTRPLIALVIVVVGTMMLRGGIGLRMLGGSSYGGRYYIYVLVGILAYFALTTRAIPLHRARLYVGLFLLGATTGIVTDLYGTLPSAFNFIFLIFAPSAMGASGAAVSRFAGIAGAAGAVCTFLLARYGVTQMLAPGRKHRFVLFCACAFVGMYGGFRSFLISLTLLFLIQFWLEGLFRTKWPWIFGAALLLIASLAVPFANRLPLAIQRTLAFLPVRVDIQAKLDAEASTQWRLQMWRAAFDEIPKYLLLGKGYGFSQQDFEVMLNRAIAAVNTEERGSFIAGDYHSGPLSVIITFGLWGSIAFLWVLVAGFRVLWWNYRHGDPALSSINAFLLAAFTTRVIMFFVVIGALNSDMVGFAGYLGLSVALNGGLARRGAAEKAGVAVESALTPAQSAKPRRLLGVG